MVWSMGKYNWPWSVAIGCHFESHWLRKWPSFQDQFQSEGKQNLRDCFRWSVKVALLCKHNLLIHTAIIVFQAILLIYLLMYDNHMVDSFSHG